jgi:hypothetical protein
MREVQYQEDGLVAEHLFAHRLGDGFPVLHFAHGVRF